MNHDELDEVIVHLQSDIDNGLVVHIDYLEIPKHTLCGSLMTDRDRDYVTHALNTSALISMFNATLAAAHDQRIRFEKWCQTYDASQHCEHHKDAVRETIVDMINSFMEDTVDV